MKKTTYTKKKKDKDIKAPKEKENSKVKLEKTSELKKKYKKGTIGQKLLIILMLFLILCLTLGIAFVLYIILASPDFNTSNLYKKEASVFLDVNGNEWARLGTENRETVTYDELPQVLIDAIVATEDSRYFQHNGIDLARFTKAVIGQLLGKSDAGGGSTLTMQVVKQVYSDGAVSGIKGIIRKFTDIYMSVFKVEKAYSKEQILEFYVNIPYLGSGTYGVEQASQTYFGKSVGDLSLAEAATIAGLFQSPDAYDPATHPELANKRKNVVLSLMERHGYISKKEKELAQSIDVASLLIDTKVSTQKYAGFLDTVRKEVKERTKNDPMTTSMIVYTTLDPAKQDVIDKIYSGESYTWKKDKVEAAMAVIDVKTGALAAVGARRNGLVGLGWNFATDDRVKRDPGSTAKPIFDYGPAIEYNNWSTGQTVVDDTYSYSGGTRVYNFDRGYKGIMTIKTALAQSRNIPAIETFQKVKQENIKEFVTNLGITPEYEKGSEYINEVHAIGGFQGVNPKQLAAAYATFARGGTYIEPHSFTKVEYINSDETYTVKPIKRKAMSDSTAFMINMILKYAVTSGNIATGTVSGTDVASKTGTSSLDSNYAKKNGIPSSAVKDSWQVTYSPDYAIALWYGCETTTKECYITMNEGTSARRSISQVLGKNILKQNSKWKQPSSVVTAQIELESDPLLLPSECTPSNLISTEYFKKGYVPTQKSTRFEMLPNPTNVKYKETASGIEITWDKVATPKAIDTDYLTDYFSKNIYKTWKDKYLNKRIEYNNSTLGELAYSIYINGNYVATTTNNNYIYNGSAGEITVKTVYTNYSACNSEGTTIVVTPSGTTSPSTGGDTKVDFSFKLNGSNPMTKEDFNNLINNNKILGTVVSNGVDVTKDATITYECNENCNADEFIVIITVKYKGTTKEFSFNVTNDLNNIE